MKNTELLLKMAFNWQQDGWPRATVDRHVLGAELREFTGAFRSHKEPMQVIRPHFESIHPFEVSKPTATRDLEELFAQGAIVQAGLSGPGTRYRLNTPLYEPIEPLNEPLNDRIFKLIMTHPGVRISYLKSVVGASLATIKRAIAALIASSKVEHRGSKKTGGYYACFWYNKHQ